MHFENGSPEHSIRAVIKHSNRTLAMTSVHVLITPWGVFLALALILYCITVLEYVATLGQVLMQLNFSKLLQIC